MPRFETGGGLTALFGRSGSGKTSLVNVIAGLIRPDAGPRRGRRRGAGRHRRAASSCRAHRRRIGYVFQEARLFPHLTVRQNLLYGRWFAPRGRARRRSRRGRRPARHRPPARRGGRRGCRAARSSASPSAARCSPSPRLLLMDEPLASLDEARKAEILPYIERLRDESRRARSSTSATRSPRWRGWPPTIVLLSEGKVAAVGPDGRGHAPARPVPADRPRRGRRHRRGRRSERHDERFGLTELRSRAGMLAAAAARCAGRRAAAAARAGARRDARQIGADRT